MKTYERIIPVGIHERLKETYFKIARGEILSADRFIELGDYIILYDIREIIEYLPSIIKPLALHMRCNYCDTEVDANNHILLIMDMMKELAIKNAIRHGNLIKEGKNADE